MILLFFSWQTAVLITCHLLYYYFAIYILMLLEKESKDKESYIKGYFPYAEHQYIKPTPEEEQQTERKELLRWVKYKV